MLSLVLSWRAGPLPAVTASIKVPRHFSHMHLDAFYGFWVSISLHLHAWALKAAHTTLYRQRLCGHWEPFAPLLWEQRAWRTTAGSCLRKSAELGSFASTWPGGLWTQEDGRNEKTQPQSCQGGVVWTGVATEPREIPSKRRSFTLFPLMTYIVYVIR